MGGRAKTIIRVYKTTHAFSKIVMSYADVLTEAQEKVAVYLEYVELFLSEDFTRSSKTTHTEPLRWSAVVKLENGNRLGYVLQHESTGIAFSFHLGNGEHTPVFKLQQVSPHIMLVFGKAVLKDKRNDKYEFHAGPNQELKRLRASLRYFTSYDFIEDGEAENAEMLEEIPRPPSNWKSGLSGIPGGLTEGFIDCAL